jgi:dUTP pyrophosphatase
MIIQANRQLTKAHQSDAGFDLESAESWIIPAGSSRLIDTGFKLAIPSGWAGIIKSRSGLSVKASLEVGAGVIDASYRGNIKVHLHNLGAYNYQIEVGDRIAQLLLIQVPEVEWLVVSDLPESERGLHGFGSTGV